MTTVQLEVTVRSPLHIGSGGPLLRNNIDFMNAGRFTYVFDQQAVFEYILPETADEALIAQVTGSQHLASFLKERDLREQTQLWSYRLGGTTRLEEIRPQIKTVFGQLYLPGSSLKGALRTALMTAIAQQPGMAPAASRLRQWRELAAREIEHDLISRAPPPAQAPNYDLLRTIQVADSDPLATNERTLALENVVVWPTAPQAPANRSERGRPGARQPGSATQQSGIPIDIEAIRDGTTFVSRLKLDDYLLGPAARALEFGSGVEIVRGWVAICREHGLARIAEEASFFADRSSRVIDFYTALEREATQAAPDTFYTQLGWGTGWHSKTLSRVITPNSRLMTTIIERYQLSKGRYEPGAPFPKTRHITTDNQPRPLGWVKVVVRN